MKNSWLTKKLGEVASVDWGNTSITKASYKPSGYLAVSATGPDGFMNSFEHDRPAIILSAIGAKCGKTFWVEGKWTAIKNTITIFSNEEKTCLTKYLYYFLTPNKWKIVGGGQPFITKGAAENVKIPLPPLAIQKQIVERLDKIASAQKLNDALIQKSDELFQSLLHQELNPAGKGWEVKKLVEILKPQYGYTAAAKETGNYRFIRITDIGEDGELRDSDKKYVTLSQNEAENYKLRNGDLLLARTGATFGKILYFKEEEPSIFASFLIRLNPDISIDPFYIWLFSRSQSYWRQAKSLMTGSGQPQFNANNLKQIKIPLSPLKTQKQIVAKLSAVQGYKTQLLAQKSKLRELFDSVLDKSMKGELDN